MPAPQLRKGLPPWRHLGGRGAARRRTVRASIFPLPLTAARPPSLPPSNHRSVHPHVSRPLYRWAVHPRRAYRLIKKHRYLFRFIKSLFPYDLIHKDYLELARSNTFEVVEPGAAAHTVDGEQAASVAGRHGRDESLTAAESPLTSSSISAINASLFQSVSPACSPLADNPHAGSGGGTSGGAGGWGGAGGAGASSPSTWMGSLPPALTGSGHKRSGSGGVGEWGSAGSARLLRVVDLAAERAEGLVSRLPSHPLSWILRHVTPGTDIVAVCATPQ